MWDIIHVLSHTHMYEIYSHAHATVKKTLILSRPNETNTCVHIHSLIIFLLVEYAHTTFLNLLLKEA